MLTKNQFLELCGIEELQLMRGKKREFAVTPIGKVFTAENLDWNKPVFVVENDGVKRPDLKGTFWFVNSTVTLGTKITKG